VSAVTDPPARTILVCAYAEILPQIRQAESPLEEAGPEGLPAHDVVALSEGQGQAVSQTGRATLSQPGGQHESRERIVQGQADLDEPPEVVVTASRKGARKPTRNPRGGLTAAGRERYRRTEGAHLQPGVKKRQSEMTPAELRRKGSWAVRFYGRKKLPPLTTADGKPTRFALTAAAWGEPVPRTVAAARRIAAKGERLLAAYQRTRQPQKKKKSGRARKRAA
jgi:hypothetical protein